MNGFQLLAGLKDVVTHTSVPFESRSTGEVASPVMIGSISVGEEIVCLQCPCLVGCMDCINVARGGGVEGVYTTILCGRSEGDDEVLMK